jgi:hypothetical protein
MISATKPRARCEDTGRSIRTTLLEVVTAVAEAASSDREVVAVIHHLFESGRMRLAGRFTERDFVAALS